MAFPPIADPNDVPPPPDIEPIDDPDQDPFQHDQPAHGDPLDPGTVPVPDPDDLPPPV